MTRYVYKRKNGTTASKENRIKTKHRKKTGGNKTRKQCGGNKTRKQCGGNKTTGFLGGLLKPLVLPALFFGAQKVQQKRVHRRKSRRGKK